MLSVAPSSPPPAALARVLPPHPHPHSHSHSIPSAHERNQSPLHAQLPTSTPILAHLPTPNTLPSRNGEANAILGPSSSFLTLAHNTSAPLSMKASLDTQSTAEVAATTAFAGIGVPRAVDRSSETQVTATVSVVEVDPVDRILATQLAHLASQHHSSEYSRSKLVHRQLPNIPQYIPVSIQNPVFVRCLRQRQAELWEKDAWFLSEGKALEPAMMQEPNATVDVEGQTQIGGGVIVMSDVRTEIRTAIEDSLPPATANGTKTSATHPIHISSLVPMASMPLLTLFLVHNPSKSPFIFNIPDHWRLHRIISPPHHPHYDPSTGSAVPQSPNWPKVPVMWSQPGSSELLHNALNTELAFNINYPTSLYHAQNHRASQFSLHLQQRQIPLVPPPTPPSQPRTPLPPSPHKRIHRRQARKDMAHGRASSAPPAIHAQRSIRRPVSVKELRSGGDVHDALGRAKSHPELPKTDLPPAALFAPASFGIQSRTEVEGAQILNLNSNSSGGSTAPRIKRSQSEGVEQSVLQMDMDMDIVQPAVNPHAPLPLHKPAIPRLGNFFLSSCPGKKVRLQGPVKGRGAICRDVRADLLRVRELGVKCIVCCLDDSELEFLGASWSEYWAVANDLGLDVLRIPISEGLAPLSPKQLDFHLTRVLEEYTLRGAPVLAHCRGGVGRAGLVACCWMLKLGLCGWRDEALCERSCGPGCQAKTRRAQTSRSQEGSGQVPLKNGKIPAPRVCRATLQLLENAVYVLRQRRSLKAIETYEQVRFLVDFIEYLESSSPHISSELPALDMSVIPPPTPSL